MSKARQSARSGSEETAVHGRGATLLSRDMSEVFQRQTTERGGHGRRQLVCPGVVEVRWKTGGSASRACVLAPSTFGRLLRD
jgi:hypothetical protein